MVVFPESIKITDVKADHSISISVITTLSMFVIMSHNSFLYLMCLLFFTEDYTLGDRVAVNSFLQVYKDGELYVDTLLGDTCNVSSPYIKRHTRLS